MRIIIVALAVFTSILTTRDADAQGLGYGIVGPAFVAGFFSTGIAGQAAGGGEVLVGGHAGAGGEMGVLAGSGGGLFVASANGVLHFLRHAPGRPSPFITGGYTRMWSGEGEFNGWNAGAGSDFMFNRHVGARVEFRDQVRPDFRGAVHYWTVRAGILFK